MPTVLRHGPYRFFWYSADRKERSHVHVERDAKTAKFWLDTLEVAKIGGFTGRDLNQIRAILQRHQVALLARWRREFGG